MPYLNTVHYMGGKAKKKLQLNQSAKEATVTLDASNDGGQDASGKTYENISDRTKNRDIQLLAETLERLELADPKRAVEAIRGVIKNKGKKRK